MSFSAGAIKDPGQRGSFCFLLFHVLLTKRPSSNPAAKNTFVLSAVADPWAFVSCCSPFDTENLFLSPGSTAKFSVGSRKSSLYNWTPPNTPSFRERYYLVSTRRRAKGKAQTQGLVFGLDQTVQEHSETWKLHSGAFAVYSGALLKFSFNPYSFECYFRFCKTLKNPSPQQLEWQGCGCLLQ